MNRSVKNRPEMIPKPNKNRDIPLPLPQYHPTEKRGVQGKKSPEMIPRRYSFTALSVIPTETAERSVPMPHMSNKRRLEWSFFLNHRNRITYNDLCRGCTHDCKQSFRAVIILCHRYYSKRWKPKEDTAYGR